MPSSHENAAILCSVFSDLELELLREDPFEALELIVPDVSIELVDELHIGDCSVSGLYNDETRQITVKQSKSLRRTRFTALHELGHDQARRSMAVVKDLATMSRDAGRRFEEKVADAFAASILIPDAAVDEILEGRAPTAHDLVALFNHVSVGGSREACCVRIAQRLTGTGYVVVAEGETLRFCATVGNAYRVARNTPQGDDHFVTRTSIDGYGRTDAVRLRHRSGSETPEFAGQAVADGGYAFAILTDATTPPWGGWTAPRTGTARAALPEMNCKQCEQTTEGWKRCEDNTRHRVCSSCGWCECRNPRAKVASKVCDTCFQTKRADLFPDRGSTCIDHS